MTPIQQLIGLLARADPGFVAGDFATRFRSASGPEGEAGFFRYIRGGFWEVSIDGARPVTEGSVGPAG
ncbi:hypothetical protein QFZ23_001942 [Arthrobacter globiformis]|uniref:hypothetical protein n=1 Tax=Arthrobacter globiformis TaxID=1665 RepID=UPI002780A4DB|nr:hypothetical protein [Arthrobacter globiformis]MDQ1058041.1 hypothetical protein [Arthrobacter globiformis]